MTKIFIVCVFMTLIAGCGTLGKTGREEPLPLTAAEKAYKISKAEPDGCEHVGGFFGYETECGDAYGATTDLIQFSCIRKEITKAGGNHGTLDAVVGNGWYKGRIFKCPAK